jgi:hypothetical protein
VVVGVVLVVVVVVVIVVVVLVVVVVVVLVVVVVVVAVVVLVVVAVVVEVVEVVVVEVVVNTRVVVVVVFVVVVGGGVVGGGGGVGGGRVVVVVVVVLVVVSSGKAFILQSLQMTASLAVLLSTLLTKTGIRGATVLVVVVVSVVAGARMAGCHPRPFVHMVVVEVVPVVVVTLKTGNIVLCPIGTGSHGEVYLVIPTASTSMPLKFCGRSSSSSDEGRTSPSVAGTLTCICRPLRYANDLVTVVARRHDVDEELSSSL